MIQDIEWQSGVQIICKKKGEEKKHLLKANYQTSFCMGQIWLNFGSPAAISARASTAAISSTAVSSQAAIAFCCFCDLLDLRRPRLLELPFVPIAGCVND